MKILLLFILVSAPVQASFNSLVEHVSTTTGVPSWVIKSICVHESQSFHNNTRQAWPWTVNVGGDGNWFTSKQYAVEFVNEKLGEGLRNVDIGICQMNYRYHSMKFTSVNHMFDPLENMIKAAEYVKQQKRADSWEIAIGRYNSPGNEERAEKYRQIVLSKSVY
ncbi:hypothetical protein OPW39_15890 [Vibrio europaeus]|uniref:hypothetical protein n=1 Tax=Vibrio europaeus TaxID=300876 RepID=UPI00233F28E2|nr:hypothetical protein [Vibrio europaeus]MDC5870290.1 hypothetical protein [Vibrio europaeus]